MQGQMTVDQRQLIYDTILQRRPKVVVEVGTWYGGGSTLAAARALAQVGGILHTYESDDERYVSAVSSYRHEYPNLMKYVVRFHHGDFLSTGVLKPQKIDLAILDGPEDATFTLASIHDCMKRDAKRLILHDWNAHKCESVRKRLDQEWLVVEKIIPDNVGIALLRLETEAP